VKPYYEHAGITIYNCDCREVLPTLPKVDLVLTDPPYGMNRFETDGKDYLQSVGPRLCSCWEHLSDPGSMFVFTSTSEVINVAVAVGKERFKRLLWMYKPADCTYPLAGWLLTSEAILWFAKGNGGLAERHPFRHDCYVHTRTGLEGVEGHPTVKPLAVIKDLARRCVPGGLILDPFLGSGTTLLAARANACRAIGIEIEERYCEIAAKRLSQEVLPFSDLMGTAMRDADEAAEQYLIDLEGKEP
jgi:site-specific DNA-methyltransferase (adenine-specific)